MHDMSLISIFLIAGAVLLLGPLAFFLTLGARTRLAETQRMVRSLEARLTQMHLQLDRLGQQQQQAPQATDPGTNEAASPTEAATDSASQAIKSVHPAPPLTEAARDDKPARSSTGLPEPPPRSSGVPSWTSQAATAASSRSGGTQSPPPPPPATGGQRGPSGPTLEERLGTRWTVWIGGLALALGALLLVRYAIEQGWFGPSMRIAMGLALAVALILAGEKLRRQEKQETRAGAPGANSGIQDAENPLIPDLSRPSIPAMLTSAGTIAAFGSIYAAHALYEFIGPALAFIALGATAVATMFAAALHGPMLAGLGLAGSLATPLFVASNNPTPWPVVLYLLVVAIATYVLARMRRWLWLALAAAIGAALWTLLFLEQSYGTQGNAFYHAALIHVLLQSAMVLYVLAYEPYRDLRGDGSLATLPSLAATGVAIAGLVALTAGDVGNFSALWYVTAAALVAMLAACAMTIPCASIAIAAAGVTCAGAVAVWPALSHQLIHTNPVFTPAELIGKSAFNVFCLLAPLSLAGAALWRVAQGPQMPVRLTSLFAGTAAITPLVVIIIAYAKVTGGIVSTTFAALAAALAVLFVIAAQVFRNGVSEHKPPAWDLALGICASAAIAALALGFTFALDGGTLTIALALAALGAAFVAVKLDIPLLRWCVAGLAVVLALRFLWEPRIAVTLSSRPVFNWLLAGYGIPAASFGLSAWLMRRAFGEDKPVRIAQAMTILATALLVYFEIRHFIYAGDPFAPRSALIEQGLLTIASLGFAIVLLRLDGGGASPVFRYASYLFGIASAAIAILGLGFAYNPLLQWRGAAISGGAFFNVLLLAYLVPGLMALLLGRMADGVRPRWYVMGARVLAMALLFGYITLQVRRAFQGPIIGFSRYTSDGEWYAYSAVWLVFGIILLAYGLWRKSVEIRIASAFFIVLSVVKVFLFDLSGLDGILRALSFIGLGGVLIGIGLVYQKWVFKRPAPGAAASTGD